MSERKEYAYGRIGSDYAEILFIPWSEITSFKMKNGLLENEMILSTSAMKIEMPRPTPVWASAARATPR